MSTATPNACFQYPSAYGSTNLILARFVRFATCGAQISATVRPSSVRLKSAQQRAKVLRKRDASAAAHSASSAVSARRGGAVLGSASAVLRAPTTARAASSSAVASSWKLPAGATLHFVPALFALDSAPDPVSVSFFFSLSLWLSMETSAVMAVAKSERV
eukprot:6173543-Pleurochrysis_carterae.AAC.6